MSALIDLAGQRFTRLVVLDHAGIKQPRGRCAKWRCLCDCGKEKTVASDHLKKGLIRSCGCIKVELIVSTFTKHGLAGSPEYSAWLSLINRCTNPNHKSFAGYGGRGISVCDSWMNSVEAFLKDMGRRPSPQHSIDRKNNDGNYEPGNCRWAIQSEQNRNKRCTRLNVDIVRKIRALAKDSHRLCEIARMLNVPYTSVKNVVLGYIWKGV